jgi:hypothetical protein
MMDFNNMPMEGGDGSKPKYNPNHYQPFGEQADYAFKQGFVPISSSNDGAITYTNNYSPAFKNVMLNNGKPEGSIQAVGNRNGLFDVQIVDKDGKVEKLIMKGKPFSQVDKYFRGGDNVIQQRVDRINQAPTNQSQYAGIQWNQ